MRSEGLYVYKKCHEQCAAMGKVKFTLDFARTIFDEYTSPNT